MKKKQEKTEKILELNVSQSQSTIKRKTNEIINNQIAQNDKRSKKSTLKKDPININLGNDCSENMNIKTKNNEFHSFDQNTKAPEEEMDSISNDWNDPTTSNKQA